jgi:hypothetical protein
MRLLLRAVGALTAITLVGVAAFYFYFDAVAGAAIETGASQALGVETRVGWVRIRLLFGEFRLGGLSIANPPGYESDRFLSLDSAHFAVTPRSLREATIEVPRFELDGVEVALEKSGGRANYDAILANLRSSTKSSSPKTEPSEATDGKRLIIHELVVRDITGHFDLGTVRGDADRVRVEIPEIRLRNVGSAKSGGVTVAEISRTIVRAVLTAVGKQAPAELGLSLLRGLRGFGSLSLEIEGLRDQPLAENAGKAAAELGGGASRAIEGAAKSTQKALGRIGGALRRGDPE